MAFTHGKNATCLMGAFDLSAYLNSITVSRDIEVADTSTFGTSAAVPRTFIPGVNNGTISLAGFWDGTQTSGPDERFHAQIVGDQVITTIGQGLSTIGNHAELLTVREVKYEIAAELGNAITIAVDGQIDGTANHGYWLHAKDTAETNGGAVNYTGVNTGLATISTIRSTLHVLAFSGTSATIKIQSSVDNVTYIDRITHTAATGVTSESKVVTGLTVTGTPTVYIRAVIAAGSVYTSITFGVAGSAAV